MDFEWLHQISMNFERILNECQNFPDFFPVAETARPQVTAALASQDLDHLGPAPGWIKHDQTLGVQMDLSIDPPFVSSTDQLMPLKLKNRRCWWFGWKTWLKPTLVANQKKQTMFLLSSVNIHIRQVFFRCGHRLWPTYGRSWETDPVKTADGMISPKKSTTVTWGGPGLVTQWISMISVTVTMLELHAV